MTIQIYCDSSGYEPLIDWLESLDKSIQRRIRLRLRRLESGNPGDAKPVGSGVFELRFAFGAGYRVYYGQDGKTIILLLCGGDKSTQAKDIEHAKIYWRNYEESKHA